MDGFDGCWTLSGPLPATIMRSMAQSSRNPCGLHQTHHTPGLLGSAQARSALVYLLPGGSQEKVCYRGKFSLPQSVHSSGAGDERAANAMLESHVSSKRPELLAYSYMVGS